jgi:pimeloyl-ACP methyl ester carboxylesterase
MTTPTRLAVLAFLAANLYAAPCVKGTAECTEWVSLSTGANPVRSLIYRTYSLDATNPNITRALIVVHGASRDADNYFRTAVAAAFLAGAMEDTIVISPRFASSDRSCKDKLDKNEVSWSCNGDSWRSGGNAASNPDLTSYDFADEILRKLANKERFPNLKSAVVTGHSAGGQFVTRYQMATKVYGTLGLPITFVVSNPSSYAYLDETRPVPDTKDFKAFSDARNCTTYNRWPYGLDKRTGYTAKVSDDQLKKQMAARPLIYLLGEIDILPLGGFDSSCPAMAQGPTRRARGEVYARYVNEKYDAHHTVTIVPLCGHNGRCMFTSEAALPILFPKQ